MIKYKELPAFETNEFKKGDRIKVYGIQDTNYIICVVEDSKEYVVSFQPSIKGQYYAHFKQCRKLEEIKPKEYWINTNWSDMFLSRNSHSPEFIKNCISLREIKEWTLFREVIEE